MTDQSATPVAPDPAKAPARAAVASHAEWLAAMEAATEEEGYVQSLGSRHWAFFHDDGPNLLVTFERAGAIRSQSDDLLPFGRRLAKAHGWSHLCLIADGDTWYRDPDVYRYFDRLINDAFFEDFERVVFYGAHMGGYAAAAFSVAAPGATVLAMQPVATLDPVVAGWDGRYLRARRLNFTDRFGFAPEMTEGAGQVFVVYDPAEREDAMHAALFHRPWVTPLRARRMGSSLEAAFRKMNLYDGLVSQAVEGTLTPLSFARLLRDRRTYGPYLRRMLAIQADAGKTAREVMICRSVVRRVRAPTFRKRLNDLLAEPKA